VLINGHSANLIAAFTLLPDGRITAKRRELEEIGLNPRGSQSPEEQITLDALPGLSYRYDERGQRIFITVGDELRVTKEYDGSRRPHDATAPRADLGGVLNYDLFTATGGFLGNWGSLSAGTSLTLDGRAFSPYGTLSQSAILRTTLDRQLDALRLDTSFAYTDADTLTTYRAGDTITGGLAWTRPIRIGGGQVQRNFAVRPDLITMPLPSFAGSAAVPSTVDVYVNNINTLSQDVGTGPYRITNVPVVNGAGEARVVLRDSAGHETVTVQPFYASARLLAPGLTDFSVEAGVPRLSYGTTLDTYVADPVVSGSLRRGIFDWLTLETHAEGGDGLANGGLGGAVRLGATGVISAAVAGSHHGGNNGWQAYLSYETSLFGIQITASSQRTFGPYDDLASVTARFQWGIRPTQQIFGNLSYLTPNLAVTAPLLPGDTRPSRQLDRISVGLPPPFFDRKSSLGLSFINQVSASGTTSRIFSASWSRSLPFNASVFATAFSDFGDKRNTGLFAGLATAIGDVATSTSAAAGNSNTGVTFDAVKPLGDNPGSYGWAVRDTEGGSPYRSAAVSYRSSYARTDATVINDPSGTRATAEVNGAVAAMGGGVFLANHINDAFAVVDAGVPGVAVSYENRPIGTTDANGKLLVSGLRSYQTNKIAIDTRNLPVDAEISTTKDVVAPADRSGAVVKFAARTDTQAAILVLVGPAGKPLPAGARGQIDGGEPSVVGYDGRAFVKGLKASNTATVTTPDRQCRASFTYEPRPGEQVVISPVSCT
jgi:outer membrane usher protein